MEDFDKDFFKRLCSDERQASVGYEYDEELASIKGPVKKPI